MEFNKPANINIAYILRNMQIIYENYLLAGLALHNYVYLKEIK